MYLCANKTYKSQVLNDLPNAAYIAQVIHKDTGETVFSWPGLPSYQVAQWVIHQWLSEFGTIDLLPKTAMKEWLWSLRK